MRTPDLSRRFFRSVMVVVLGAALTFAILVIASPLAEAFDLLVPAESFETDGEGSRYLSNAHTDGGGDYFERHMFKGEGGENPHPGQGFAIADVSIDGDSGGIGGGASSLSSSGTYTTFGQFLGTEGPALIRDDDVNGAIDGSETTALSANALGNYTFVLSGTNGLAVSGDNLSIQIVVNVSGNEEIVFDHIRITGDPALTDPPVLAGIEGAAIIYYEGSSATLVTSTLTVADDDSPTLASGTVTISGGVPAEDLLHVTGTGPIVVSGNGTNSLSLVGSGTLAEYQTVLRSVTYTNSNATDPIPGMRTVNFLVNDGTSPSNGQSRQISVNKTIAGPISLPVLEDFDTGGDGEGVRYTSNTFSNGASDYFERSTTNPHPGVSGGDPFTVTPPQGGSYWASEDVDSPPNPIPPDGILRLADFDVAGFSNLEVTIYLADNLSGAIETTDSIEVEVQFDGTPNSTDLTSGIYTTVGRFVGDGAVMRQDMNLDGLSSDPADAGSPTLSRTMTPYTFSIPGTGSLLSVQVRIIQPRAGANEEFAFDHISVNGAMAGNPPVLANIEGVPATFTEGNAPVQLTNTITTTDTDSTDLEGAIIQLTVGYQNGEDSLAVNGALPAGITEVLFSPLTGQIGLTGSAPIADYQTALRQITYENTSVNPNICDRTVNFQVTASSACLISMLQGFPTSRSAFIWPRPLVRLNQAT